MELVKVSNLFGNEQIFVQELGIFSYLAQVDALSEPVYPLVKDFINQNNYQLLDVDYEIGFSAEKWFSPIAIRIIKKICDDNSLDFNSLVDNTMDDNDKNTIIAQLWMTNGFGDMVYQRFGVKWYKIFEAINTVYKPLENYSMKEKRTPDITKETTFDTTDERTPDLTKTTNGTGTTETDSTTGIYGFNSSDSNPSGTIDGNQTDTITDRTETETGTDTSTKTGTITDTETGTEDLERSGNIGVTTSQQMLESEIQIRQYDFYKGIYEDIDSILCLKSY